MTARSDRRSGAPAEGRLGPDAEARAARWLASQGLTVVERNYRSPLGEIDIVALEGRTLVFVEVKARRGRSRGSALEAVTPAKQARLVRLAKDYLARRGLGTPACRFDVVACQREEDDLSFRHVRAAFDAEEPRR